MTQHGVWGFVALAWLFSACGDDPPAAPAEPAPAPAPAKEEAAPPEEAPIEIEEPAPTGEPPLPIGLTVLQASKAKTPLAAASETGVAHPLDIVFSATLRDGKTKRPLLFPTVKMKATQTRDAPGKATLAVGGVTLGEGPGFDAAAVAAVATEVGAGTAAIETTEWSAVSSLSWPATTVQNGSVDLAAAARHALSHASLPTPTDPIGPGGRWAVKRPIELFGAKALETVRIKLVKVYGAQVEITAKIEYELDPEATGVTSLKGSGSMFARMHLPSATPIEMHIVSVVAIESTGADGKSSKRTIDFDARIDEDYLAVADARVKLDGRFTQGGLIHGAVAPGTKVWHEKERVKLSDAGDFLIGFGRDAGARARIGFQFPGGEIERHIVRVEQRTYTPEEINGLPPEMVDYDNATERALAKSRKRVNKVRGKSTDHTFFKDGWRWPLKGKITSTYGRKRILNGKEKGYHWGLDIAARVGAKVRAPAPGVVVLAETDVPLSGMLLILDHGHGLSSSFLHLSAITVKVGDVVKAGQVIAKTGNTGRTTGPHLDWRMNLAETRIDPQLLLRKK